jgi:hypothetical protein
LAAATAACVACAPPDLTPQLKPPSKFAADARGNGSTRPDAAADVAAADAREAGEVRPAAAASAAAAAAPDEPGAGCPRSAAAITVYK